MEKLIYSYENILKGQISGRIVVDVNQ